MRSYLEGNRLPTVRTGQVDLPRLIVGIHPYDEWAYVDRDRENLKRFGQVAQVKETTRWAKDVLGSE